MKFPKRYFVTETFVSQGVVYDRHDRGTLVGEAMKFDILYLHIIPDKYIELGDKKWYYFHPDDIGKLDLY